MNLNALIASMLVALATADPAADQYPPPKQTAPPNDAWSQAVLPSLNVADTPSAAPMTRLRYDLGVYQCIGNSDWAITYDDGPTQFTPQLLEALAKRNVKATFFVLGMQVVQFPQFLKDAYNAGHQIGIHTWSHQYMTTLTNEQIVSEIVWTAKAIKETIGVTPVYFRPPFGDMDERVHAVTAAMGLKAALWNFVSGDANTPTNPNLVADMTAEAQKTPKYGHISLEHDIAQLYVDEAILALDAVIASGYNIVTMDQCIGDTAVYDESFWTKFGPNTVSPISNGAAINSSRPAVAATSNSNISQIPIPKGSSGNTSGGNANVVKEGISFFNMVAAIALGIFAF